VNRKDTKLVEAGRAPSLHAGAVNPPVYRVSTVLFPDVETMQNESQPYTYGRRGTPTTRALEEALCELEGGAIICW
jgi:cystathionine beta-lyase